MGQDNQSLGPVSPSALFLVSYRLKSRTGETPLKSTHTMPERVYNLSYALATQTLLVSMSHRHVYVYSLPDLTAAGDDAKPQSSRESALKFLTRSVACMADGKGTCFLCSI
jgi:cell cycle arrest protein BUB3